MSGNEDEIFEREWEMAERSRHSRLLDQLKREYRESPRAFAPAEAAIAAPYSLRLPHSIPRQQVKPQSQYRSGSAQRSPRDLKE